MRYVIGAVALLGLTSLLLGSTGTVPNTFAPGQIISASKMNENFLTAAEERKQLLSEIEKLTQELATVKSQIPSLASDSSVTDRLNSLASSISVVNSSLTSIVVTVNRHDSIFGNVRKDGCNVIFEGVNLVVRDSAPDCGPVQPGLGNLIVGREDSDGTTCFCYSHGNIPERTGSNNLVVGGSHEYTGTGGLIVGRSNRLAGDGSVVFGECNSSTGNRSSVPGGKSRSASHDHETTFGVDGHGLDLSVRRLTAR